MMLTKQFLILPILMFSIGCRTHSPSPQASQTHTEAGVNGTEEMKVSSSGPNQTRSLLERQRRFRSRQAYRRARRNLSRPSNRTRPSSPGSRVPN
jgi:hypothetical protein